QVLGELAGGALGGLERDIPCKALRPYHVDGALADIVALHEAVIVEMRQFAFAQDAARLPYRLESLDLLDPDIEETDGRPRTVEQRARHGAAHGGKVDKVAGIRADGGAEVEHDRFAFQGRPERGNRRPLDAGHGLE